MHLLDPLTPGGAVSEELEFGEKTIWFYCMGVIGLLILILTFALPFSVPLFTPGILSSVAVSPLNATGSRLTAAWNLSFIVTNLSARLKVVYQEIQASIFYGQVLLLSQTANWFRFLKTKGATGRFMRVYLLWRPM